MHPFPIEIRYQSRQSGLAIITVMLIIALMVTLLGFLVEQQHLLVRRISNQNIAEQGFQYASGVEAWAARVLHDDVDRQTDYWGEDWARFGDPRELDSSNDDRFSLDLSSEQQKEKLPTIDFGSDVALDFQIVDLMGRYNLNNLSVKQPELVAGQRSIFLNLLSILEIGDLDQQQQLYGALVDWLDENDLVTANGFESSDYQIKRNPYYAADQKLTSLGELRYVEGFTEEVINALEPHVTVLPVDVAKININTSSVEVLSAMSAVPVSDTGSVAAFLAQRQVREFIGFQSAQIQEAITAIIGTSLVSGRVVPNMLQTTSQFFQINTNVTLGDYSYCTKTTVLRENANPDADTEQKITILNREQSTLCDEIIRENSPPL
jgi:general secretion pathway protein K